MMLFEADFTFASVRGAHAAGVVLRDERAAPAHEQAAQLRQFGRRRSEVSDRQRRARNLLGGSTQDGRQPQRGQTESTGERKP